MNQRIRSVPSQEIQNLADFQLPDNFRGRPGWYVQFWWVVQSIFFGLSPQFMYAWRRWLLRLFGAKIGKMVLIRSTARVTYPWKVTIGDFSWIGDDVTLYSLGEISLGNNVVVSQRAYLCTASHDYSKPNFDINSAPIQIMDNAWLATDVFVAPGVTVCEGAVVGARSSVFHDIPPMTVCVGTPARPIKQRL